MSKVFEIAITNSPGDKINKINSIKAIAGKGLLNDRFYKDNNPNASQVTLIEKEKIDEFNKKLNLEIKYVDFRRNIVTQGISLNNLVNKDIKIGEVSVKVIEVCEPCSHLQDIVGHKNIVKNLLHKAGVRCQTLNDGTINVGDTIKYYTEIVYCDI